MTASRFPRIQIVKMLVDPPSGRGGGEEEEEVDDGKEFDQVHDRTRPALLLRLAMMVIKCDRAHTHVSFLSASPLGTTTRPSSFPAVYATKRQDHVYCPIK